MYSLLAAVLLATDLSGLSLTTSSSQKEVLVGEPLRVTFRWKATAPVKDVAVEESDFVFQSILLSVDDGHGALLYREYRHQMTERLLVLASLKTGDEEVVDLVFYRGGYVDRPTRQARDSFLFPRAGEYSVTAIYLHDGVPKITSNRLHFTVTEPSESDRVVMEQVRRDPTLVSADGSADSRALVKSLLEKYPQSPYLRWAKLERFKQRQNALNNEYDPDTGQSIFHLGKEGMGAFRRQHYRRMAEEILSDREWGPFEDEALGLASLYAYGAGDEEISARAKKDLFEKYPRSATVKRIKDEEAKPDVEDEAPVKPSPKPKE
jgi:hypothetical protein